MWRRECPRGGCSSHYYRPRAAAAAGRGGAGPHPMRPAGERATPTHVRRREQKHESGACRARAHEVLVIDHP